MAIKTQRKAIMINPAIKPAELLVQFIGVSENFELKQPYDWTQGHCDQYRTYENALKQASDNLVNRIVLLDMADELIDSYKTQKQYAQRAEIIAYEGGSHSFEHIEEALSVIEKVIYT